MQNVVHQAYREEAQRSLEAGAIAIMSEKFSEGWKLYANRCNITWPEPRFYHIPRWDGSDIKGKTLLLCYEQAIGEQILFSQFLPELTALGINVIYECEHRLIPVLKRSFPEVTFIPWKVPYDERVYEADYWCFHGDVGEWLRPSLDSFKNTLVGFLKPDPERVKDMRAALGTKFDLSKPIIGLSWFSRAQAMSKNKSIPFELFKPLCEQRQVVSLQYGKYTDPIYSVPGLDMTRDIDGLAALAKCCDLVISCSNASAHVSAAVGTRTWVLLTNGHGRHFYWSINRLHGLLYPTSSTGIQREMGEWKPLVDIVVKKALTDYK